MHRSLKYRNATAFSVYFIFERRRRLLSTLTVLSGLSTRSEGTSVSTAFRSSVARRGQSREKSRVGGESEGYEFCEKSHALRLM